MQFKICFLGIPSSFEDDQAQGTVSYIFMSFLKQPINNYIPLLIDCQLTSSTAPFTKSVEKAWFCYRFEIIYG